MKWFAKIFQRSKENLYHVKYEKSHITALFEDLEQNYIKKKRLTEYCQELERRELALEKYDLLSEQDIGQLVLLGNQHKEIEEKRDLLRSRLIKNNAALNRLQPYEEQLPELIKELSSVEKNVKDSERDLFYLDEERELLRGDRETLLRGYQFLKYFSVFLGATLIIVLFVVFALMQTLREAVWIYLSGVGCIFVLFLASILFAKENIEKRLRDNEFLQKKAARYSNKAKIRSFNNKNYLQFQFAKLGVDSVAKLEMYYNRYIKSKSNEVHYAGLTRKLVELEKKIETLFEAKGIVFDDFDAVEEWLIAPKRAKVLDNVIVERQKNKQQLDAVTTYEEELWKEIYILKEAKETKEIVSLKIKEYQEIILALDKKQKTA